MSTDPMSTGYGPSSRYARLMFSGDEDRYEAWETRFLGHMELKDMKEIIDPPTISTEPVDATKNSKCFAELISFLDDTSLGLVMRDAKGDGRKALAILRTHYAGKGTARVVTLYTELTKLEKTSSETMTDYILRAEKSATLIKSAGFDCPDPLLIAMVMKGLPDTYQPFIVVTTQSEITDFSKFKSNLRNYEETERARGGGSGGDSVFKAGGYQRGKDNRGGGGGQGGGQGRGAGGARKKQVGPCHKCKEFGHLFKQCPNKQPAAGGGEKKWCGICNNSTHHEANCRKRDKANTVQEREGQHSFQFKVMVMEKESTESEKEVNQSVVEDVPAAVSDVVSPVEELPHCQEYLSRDASFDFDRLRDVDDVVESVVVEQTVVEPVVVEPVVVAKPTPTVVVEPAVVVKPVVVAKPVVVTEPVVVEPVVTNPQPVVVEGATSITACMKVQFAPKDTVVESLLVDTGATAHIFRDESKFSSFDPTFTPEDHYVELADGTKHNEFALKRGDVRVTLRDKLGNRVAQTLKKALHIPTFPTDIFSVSSAVEDDAAVVFRKEESELILKNGTRFEVKKRNKLFFLENVEISKVNAVGIPKVPTRKADMYLWHRILGHCNSDDVKKLEGIVDGMKILPSEKVQCETCILGKQTQNRNREPDERAKKCMELVHTDLAGPINPTAKDGFRYAISFVDDYSSATFIYFLKRKSDAPRALSKFLADARPYGPVKELLLDPQLRDPQLCPVQRLRSDNGGEFISNEFCEILLKNSIKHEKSAPHSPHQNGTVERGWRTLFNMARCLLIESKLPRSLWTYAVMAAVFIRNRCYHQRTQQTPYFLLTGRKPDLSKMHVFGSICYPYKVTKTKLDDRSVKGVFVGYDKESPAYIVYYPNQNKLLTHRVVTFTDTVYPIRRGDGVVQNNLVLHCDEDDDYPGVTFPSERRGVDPEVVIVDPQEPAIENPAVDVTVPDVDNVEPRRNPPRDRRPPGRLDDYVLEEEDMDTVGFVQDCERDFENLTFCFRASVAVPKTYKQAVSSSEADKWKSAMDEEMQSLSDNNTYSLVPLPEGKQAVGGRWVYSVKVEPGGNERYKARYVAQGFKQVHGSDYYETFAPTPKMSSIRMMMQMAAELDLLVHQLDVKTAYLNAEIDCEIFMNQPIGYEQSSGNVKMVCKLNKALYGLKQSGRMWNNVLSSFLKDHCFVQSKHDPCLYIYREDPETAFLLHWVDDIILAASSVGLQNAVKKWLKDRFHMKDLGRICEFLGIRFKQENGTITMDQSKYLQNKLIKYNLHNCKTRPTPCELVDYDQNREASGEEKVNNKLYREMVGSLIYAMTCTRPDISWAVSKLSRKLSNPSQGDFVMLKHVFRYILGTLDYSLTFRKSVDGLRLIGFSDSDWAGSLGDRKSTSGYVFQLDHDGPTISWKSKKQETVALSSCEAEYIAGCAAAQEAIYLARVFGDFCHSEVSSPVVVNPVVLNIDNQGAMGLAKNPVSHNKSKHIEIKYHFLRECVIEKKVVLNHVPSAFNVADLLTKPLARVKFSQFVKSIFGKK